MERKKTDMKEKMGMKRPIIGYILLIAALILGIQNITVVVTVLQTVVGVLQPLILGAVIAYILNILMKKLEKIYFPKSKNRLINKTKRMVCIILSLLLVIGILGLVMGLVLPELAGAFAVIAESVPVYYEKLVAWLMTYSDKFPVIEEYINGLQLDWSQITKNLVMYATSGVGGIFNSAISVVSVVVGGIVNFVIALIFAIYLLAGKEKLSAQLKRVLEAYLSEKKRAQLAQMVAVADNTFSSFIL